jgi:hypothetical protein
MPVLPECQLVDELMSEHQKNSLDGSLIMAYHPKKGEKSF